MNQLFVLYIYIFIYTYRGSKYKYPVTTFLVLCCNFTCSMWDNPTTSSHGKSLQDTQIFLLLSHSTPEPHHPFQNLKFLVQAHGDVLNAFVCSSSFTAQLYSALNFRMHAFMLCFWLGDQWSQGGKRIKSSTFDSTFLLKSLSWPGFVIVQQSNSSYLHLFLPSSLSTYVELH